MNRRVPNKNVKRYTIVGDGKVAKHFSHYFNLIGVDHNSWSRNQSMSSLKYSIQKTDIVLLLISDSAIETFVQEHLFLHKKTLVHFSGTITSEFIKGCHPLMTFSEQLYDLDVYESVPFICDDGVDFSELFPQLSKNSSFSINSKDKAFYHSMCVIAGNFTQTLMRESTQELTKNTDLPVDIMFPYLLQNTKNFIANPNNSATGPIQRGDFTTVKKHLQSLQLNPLAQIYRSFVKLNAVQKVSQINLKQSSNFSKH